MKAIVCGGRDFNDEDFIFKELNKLHAIFPFTEIIDGGASGADSIATLWATRNKIPNRTYFAQWGVYGKTAGHIRNKQMLELKPNLVIAFPGGSGTHDMIMQATAVGITVIQPTYKKG